MKSTRDLPWMAIKIRQDGVKDNLNGGSFEENLEALGLGWEPRKDILDQTILTPDGVRQRPLDEWRLVVRDDNEDPLGIVGANYGIYKNRSFARFMDSIVEAGSGKRAGLGTLRRGRVVYGVVELDPDQFQLDGSDGLGCYVYGWNAHDGSAALHAGVSIIRWACTNGLVGLVPNSTHFVKVKHSRTVTYRAATATKVLHSAAEYIHRWTKEVEELKRIRLTSTDQAHLIERLIPVPRPTGKNNRAVDAANQRRMDLREFVHYSPNLHDERFTGWAWVNAVAEWDQHGEHKRRTRSNLERFLAGDEASVVARARSLVLA